MHIKPTGSPAPTEYKILQCNIKYIQGEQKTQSSRKIEMHGNVEE